ncbi:MAG: hypothetical protein U1E21_24490 [Reyranellaceae bacterium]
MRRRAARAVPEALEAPSQQLPETLLQARQHAYGIPQQRGIGRIMDVGLHHRRVDTQLRAVFQSEIDRRPHNQIIDHS